MSDLKVADNKIECLLDDDDDDDTDLRENNENREDNNELPKHLLKANPPPLQPVTTNNLANVILPKSSLCCRVLF